MFKHTRILALALILALTIVPLTASAVSDATSKPYSWWFDETQPYEELPIVSEQLVCAEEVENAGFAGMILNCYDWKMSSAEGVLNRKEYLSMFYQMDSQFLGLPSLNEEFSKYDEAYFENYRLIIT